jgi:hypothetical protein
MIKRLFVCDVCDAQGMISISSVDVSAEEICHCPVCGAPLLAEDDYEDEE